MGVVPSGDSCTTTVSEEGVERRRDGVGAPGRTGGVCICVRVYVCVCGGRGGGVCMCVWGGEEEGRVQILSYTTIHTCEWFQILMSFIAHTSLDVYTTNMHAAVSLCTAGDKLSVLLSLWCPWQ